MKYRRSRKVITRSTDRVIGKYFSWKTAQMVRWESQLERDFIFLLDADPKIKTFCEQPFTLKLSKNSTAFSYTPDFLTIDISGQETVFEVKPSIKVHDFAQSEKVQCVKNHLASENKNFIIIDETKIRREPRLTNAKLLLRFRSHCPISEVREAMLHSLQTTQGQRLSSLRATISHPDAYKEIMRMILEGVVSFPSSEELNQNSLITIREKNDERI